MNDYVGTLRAASCLCFVVFRMTSAKIQPQKCVVKCSGIFFLKKNVLYGVFIKQLDGFGENRKSFVENGLEPGGGGIRVFRYSVVSYGGKS